MESRDQHIIQVGKWGQLEIKNGYYLYVGSAFGPGGVRARVSRHCHTEKPRRWHIDYLREYTNLPVVWYTHDTEQLEHRWAKSLEDLENTDPIKGFGCSDCHCPSHLFYVTQKTDLSTCLKALPGNIYESSCTDLS